MSGKAGRVAAAAARRGGRVLAALLYLQLRQCAHLYIRGMCRVLAPAARKASSTAVSSQTELGDSTRRFPMAVWNMSTN